MAKSSEKLRSLTLRRAGKSLREIAVTLNVSKSTAGLWCKDVILSSRQKNNLHQISIKAGSKGRLIGTKKNKETRENKIRKYEEDALREISALSRRELLIAGIALYWAEGSKTDRSQLAFVNSDPILIMFMYKWFQVIFGVKPSDFLPRVSINETHRARVGKVLSFWSKRLKLPESQFRKTTFIKAQRKKIYENHDLYFGVLSLRIRRSTDYKYKILGLIKALGKTSG